VDNRSKRSPHSHKRGEPGTIDTPGLSNLLASSDAGEQRKKMISSSVPLGRFGTPDEIAKAVVFLASNDSSSDHSRRHDSLHHTAEVEKLAAAERKFAETLPPVEALRAWMLLFVDYIAAKQIIAPALNALVGDPKKVFDASYAQIWQAIRALVKRAIKSGDIRRDLDAIDLLRALSSVANTATSPDWQQSAERLVDILVTGSRPIK
jgi:AcrR family transcriptional regulator